MIGVWNGKDLSFKDVGAGEKLFDAMRGVLGGGLVEVMPDNVSDFNRLTSALRKNGILVAFDEEGLRKNLPVTLELETVSLVGNIIFCGWENSDFKPLTQKQQGFLAERMKSLKEGG
jgi:hypothetical protein